MTEYDEIEFWNVNTLIATHLIYDVKSCESLNLQIV